VGGGEGETSAALSQWRRLHCRVAAAKCGVEAGELEKGEAVFDPFKLTKILQDSPSHRIFRRMYRVLNIDKKITNYTVCL
jgi:hypothetical protein